MFAALALGVAYSSQAQNERKNEDGSAYTVIANPGEKADSQVRINWHVDADKRKENYIYLVSDGVVNMYYNGDLKKNYCTYTKRSDTKWKKAKKYVLALSFARHLTAFTPKRPTERIFMKTQFLCVTK